LREKKIMGKKTIVFTITGLVIGIGLGIIGSMAYLGRELARGMFMLHDMELVRNENSAIQAYLNESPEVGIWALENYIKAINRVIKEREIEDNQQAFFIVQPKVTLRYAHVRLALLYEKTGNDSKRKENFEKAFEYCDSMKIEREHLEKKLIELVAKLDSQFEPLDDN
jgi:hypothetical protein